MELVRDTVPSSNGGRSSHTVVSVLRLDIAVNVEFKQFISLMVQ